MVLLPSLNRPKLLDRFVESFIQSKAICPLWILVNDADYEKNKEAYDEIQKKIQSKKYISADSGLKSTADQVSMGDKVRYVWPRVVSARPSWVGILNDDHLCATNRWDKIVSEMIDGTNFLSTNDGFWNFGINPCGLTAWSYAVLEAAGFPIFPGKLQHWFVDDLWKQIGLATGSWVETMAMDFPHRHVFKGEMEPDDTFKRIQNENQMKMSQMEFQKFMTDDFPGVVERIKALQTEKLRAQKFQ